MPAFVAATALTAMRPFARTLLILPLFAASLALAADKPKKEGSFGGSKGAGAYLTKEQLRVCLDRQAKVKQEDAAMRAEQAAIATLKGETARTGDELKSRLETVDRTSAEAVATYNDAVQARDRQIDDYQKRVDAFNTRVEANQAERDAFGQGCNNRRYFEEDELAIKKGK